MFKSFRIPFLLLVMLTARQGFAGDSVTLHIRTVKAAGTALSKTAAADSEKPAPVIDDRLDDLRAKLTRLPYNNFRLLSSQEISILPLRKTTIRLDGGQLLNVRLLYADKERVGMWVRWADKDGMKLLDSRMHFNCTEPVLTGTSSSGDSAVILALGVEQEQ